MMDTYNQQAQTVIETWFSKAPSWQKDLFNSIWNGCTDDSLLTDRAHKLIDQEYFSQNHRSSPNTTFPSNLELSETQTAVSILKGISNVYGVGALTPSAPLTFNNGLNVVYGENGCGKSSYVRILKALENPEYSSSVFGNVFTKDAVAPEATVSFTDDGLDYEIKWTKRSNKKYPLQIYDTAAAKQFVDKENEVSYEPKVLAIITKMANVLELLSQDYRADYEANERKITPVPIECQGHSIISDFSLISSLKEAKAFCQKYFWNDTLHTELSSILLSLQEQDPQKVAQQKSAQLRIIQQHGYRILELHKFVTDEKCQSFLKKRTEQITTKKLADTAIEDCKKTSLFKSFGSEEWLAMWGAALKYIQSMDSSQDLPISSDNRCALCQQELSTTTQDRIGSFSDFLKSDVMSAAHNAFESFKEAVRELQTNVENIINIEEIDELLRTSAVPDNIRETILAFYTNILQRCNYLLDYNVDLPLPKLYALDEIIETFKSITTQLKKEIDALEKTYTNRESQTQRALELSSIQWCYANLSHKETSLVLSSIITKCKTNSLTSLKNSLSTILITDAYISKFSNEMKFLDPKNQIRVQLVAKAPRKGKSYHEISLRGACSVGKHKNGEVLSEGEFRIVSLAAFLADLSSWKRVTPFIFDDPITSLDHKFEARVAQRLVRLSTERQVIVFTHRLAFAQLLHKSTSEYNAQAKKQELATQATITHIELRNKPLGQPVNAAYVQKISMKSALNEMINQDIARIRKFQKLNDYDTADHLLQSVAARFRNLIEGGIEHNLLQGIVSRFDYKIYTQKLPYLFALTKADIDLFDQMMTKYSSYDHSQSIEITVPPPDVDDLEHDLQIMQRWIEDYTDRSEKAKKQYTGKC